MPRLKEIPKAEVSSETVLRYYKALFGERDPVAEPGTATGTPGNWWSVFANSPDVFDHAVNGFALYRGQRKLDPVLRELGQTRVGWATGSQFVFSQHCKSLRGLKVSEERIAAIPSWQTADCYSKEERAVLAYTDCLAAGGRTPDGVFEALKAFLSDEEIMELTYIVCMYGMHAVISRALRLEYDDRDDPIVEIAAPQDFAQRDFLDTQRRYGAGGSTGTTENLESTDRRSPHHRHRRASVPGTQAHGGSSGRARRGQGWLRVHGWPALTAGHDGSGMGVNQRPCFPCFPWPQGPGPLSLT
jgi:alkylhydroperoxidase family enzyme